VNRHRFFSLIGKLTRPSLAWVLVGGVFAICAILAVSVFAPHNLTSTASITLVGIVALAMLALSLMITSKDAAGQKTRIQALSDLRSRYGQAEDLAQLGSWVYHIGSDSFSFSEGGIRLFGLSDGNTSPSLQDFQVDIHPDDQGRWRDAMERGIHKRQETRIEFRYVRFKNGASAARSEGKNDTIWVRCIARPELDDDRRVLRLAGTAQDVTSMRAMQKQLAASEAKFRDLIQMSSDWFWETDTEHRTISYSDSVDAVIGNWVRSTLGRTRWEASTDVMIKPNWDGFRATLDAHQPFENFEYSRLDPEGNVVFMRINGRPIFDTAGKFTGYRGVGQNITREHQQQVLLQIEGELATIIREQNDPSRVITATFVAICGLLGWLGGGHLIKKRDVRALQMSERWGYPAITKMLADLPQELPIDPISVEGHAWMGAKPVWLRDVSSKSDFVSRYQCAKTGIKASFVAPIKDEQGRVISALIFFSPASYRAEKFLSELAELLSRTLSSYLQRKAAEQRLLHASMHDALTALPNRIYLTEQLDKRLHAGEPCAVLYVDLDKYKIINDTLGHSVGDQVLIEVARRFKQTIRPSDVAGRIGGDEFILLLNQLSNRQEIERIAREVLAAIEKPFILSNRAYFLSASIGVAIAPENGTDGKVLIRCADNAMYRVKSAGRNDVLFYTGDMSDERTEQLELTAELPLAIKRGEVTLFYQPILDVVERKVACLEALMRWNHPTKGLLLPDKFLPIAEQSNLIRELGFWAIERAIDDRISLGMDVHTETAVSVNISVRQLTEEGFLGAIADLLEEKKYPASLLRLELTESSFIEHPEKTIQLIMDLRRIGIKVIIDNFGTGYASLAYVKNLPVDGIKIDRAFITNLATDRGNSAIVQAVSTLARKLGMHVMAEGVETATELKALRGLECDQIQGTLICAPVPLEAMREFMENLPMLRQMHVVSTNQTSNSA
jgi:diguanylate cyclase (GGDEF)-like protein/PAS domain S-box-containing protein